jgi:hypothetical protein
MYKEEPQETLHPARTCYIHPKNGENALQDITDNPALYSSSVIYTKYFVLVKDRTPRASLHLLLTSQGMNFTL